MKVLHSTYAVGDLLMMENKIIHVTNLKKHICSHI